MVLAAKMSNLEDCVHDADTLAEVGIKVLHSSRTGKISYLRTFDKEDYVHEDGTKEVLGGYTTFMKAADVGFVVETHQRYQTLMQGNIDDILEALHIARNNLGKRPLTSRAEMKIRTYVLERIQEGTEASLQEAHRVLKNSLVEDNSITQKLSRADHLLSEAEREGQRQTTLRQERKDYLDLIQPTLEIELKTVIKDMRSSLPPQEPLKAHGDEEYSTLMKIMDSGSARKAFIRSVSGNYEPRLIKDAYARFLDLSQKETHYQELAAENTPKAHLQALEYSTRIAPGQVPELGLTLARPVIKYQAVLIRMRDNIEGGLAQHNGDYISGALAPIRLGQLPDLYPNGEEVARVLAGRYLAQMKSNEAIQEARKLAGLKERAGKLLGKLFGSPRPDYVLARLKSN